ncbi:hypothetical protein [Bradyrhizobium sp. STM 3562]|uniref:hypothetical protein n=1 Tax=Bradyrhizobium sp. STM 3562 TaxID=578924 RepID=UPI00388D582D
MKAFAIALLAGIGALSAGSAKATDLLGSSGYSNPDPVQQVRLVCDDMGRCYHTRGHAYSYDYGPRYRYERRYYREEPRAGIGIYGPGGVGVGVGVGPY